MARRRCMREKSTPLIDSVFEIPPFVVRLRSPFAAVTRHWATFYADNPQFTRESFVDFDVQVLPGKGVRRWWNPQARFLLDGVEPFHPVPAAQAAPMFEYFVRAEEGLDLLREHPALQAWWQRVGTRAAVVAACGGETT